MGSGDCAQAFTLARAALDRVRCLPSTVSGDLCRLQALMQKELLGCLHRWRKEPCEAQVTTAYIIMDSDAGCLARGWELRDLACSCSTQKSSGRGI